MAKKSKLRPPLFLVQSEQDKPIIHVFYTEKEFNEAAKSMYGHEVVPIPSYTRAVYFAYMQRFELGLPPTREYCEDFSLLSFPMSPLQYKNNEIQSASRSALNSCEFRLFDIVVDNDGLEYVLMDLCDRKENTAVLLNVLGAEVRLPFSHLRLHDVDRVCKTVLRGMPPVRPLEFEDACTVEDYYEMRDIYPFELGDLVSPNGNASIVYCVEGCVTNDLAMSTKALLRNVHTNMYCTELCSDLQDNYDYLKGSQYGRIEGIKYRFEAYSILKEMVTYGIKHSKEIYLHAKAIERSASLLKNFEATLINIRDVVVPTLRLATVERTVHTLRHIDFLERLLAYYGVSIKHEGKDFATTCANFVSLCAVGLEEKIKQVFKVSDIALLATRLRYCVAGEVFIERGGKLIYHDFANNIGETIDKERHPHTSMNDIIKHYKKNMGKTYMESLQL